jgi:very-short-patch-repair endonuclease
MERRPDDGREPSLDELLAKQHRVIARSQLLDAGMTVAMLRHRLREGGPWRVILPGVYLTSNGASTVRQLEVAAILYAGPGSMITGPAALRRFGIRASGSRATDVLVPAQRRRTDSGFVRVHRTKRMPSQFFIDGILRYAPEARAIADTARLLTSARDVRAVVADAVQRGKCLPRSLFEELNEGPVQHSALLRLALDDIVAGIRSPAEADLRILIKRFRLPEPMFNARLYAGTTFIGAPDCWWPDAGVAAEVDSREWHLSPEDWERTMSRRSRMSSHGINVLHFTPNQIRTQPRQVATTIRSTLKASAGRSLPITAVPAQ